MEISLATLAAATIVFAATNIDDIVILAAFYGDSRIGGRAIIAGQFLGIAALTGVSAGAAYLALTVPPDWISLLGLVPLAMGVYKLIELRKSRDPNGDGDRALVGSESNIKSSFRSQTASVTAVTIANGGDNLSVYIPLFANDTSIIPSYATTFMALTGLWCMFGYLLVKNPAGAAIASRWGHIILPVVLIAIGGYILWGGRVLLN